MHIFLSKIRVAPLPPLDAPRTPLERLRALATPLPLPGDTPLAGVSFGKKARAVQQPPASAPSRRPAPPSGAGAERYGAGSARRGAREGGRGGARGVREQRGPKAKCRDRVAESALTWAGGARCAACAALRVLCVLDETLDRPRGRTCILHTHAGGRGGCCFDIAAAGVLS